MPSTPLGQNESLDKACAKTNRDDSRRKSKLRPFERKLVEKDVILPVFRKAFPPFIVIPRSPSMFSSSTFKQEAEKYVRI